MRLAIIMYARYSWGVASHSFHPPWISPCSDLGPNYIKLMSDTKLCSDPKFTALTTENLLPTALYKLMSDTKLCSDPKFIA